MNGFMEKCKYVVWFKGYNFCDKTCITVHAFNHKQAMILAQAERIKNELHYEVSHVKIYEPYLEVYFDIILD
jgi:hypothetical protein